jgi:Rrf2 family protein
MKLITRDTDYALRALLFLAKHKRVKFSVSDLVRELQIPKPFLRKIFQILNKEGIVYSSKGSGGGFLLAEPLDRIFLLDLMQILQGDFRINECFFKKIKCPNMKNCILRKKISNIEKYVIDQLKNISLASLIKS